MVKRKWEIFNVMEEEGEREEERFEREAWIGALKRQSKIKVQRWFFFSFFQWRNRERERNWKVE